VRSDPYPFPRRTTPLPVVFVEQVQLLFQRLRWEWLVLAALVALTLVSTRLTLRVGLAGGPYLLFIPLYLLLGIYWGLAVWKVEEDPARGYLWSAPVERSGQIQMRLLAGGLLLLGGILAGYAAGSLLPVSGSRIHRYLRMESPEPLTLWSVNTIGMLNTYLVAALLSLRTRNPERWLFLWLPMGVLFFILVCHVLALDVLLWFFGDLVLLSLFAPAAGTGLPTSLAYYRFEPQLVALLPLLVMMVLVLLSMFLSRRYREA
jgi:hypothetical protein